MSVTGALAAAALACVAQAVPDAPAPGAARDTAIRRIHSRAARVQPGSREGVEVAGELERIGAAYLAEGDTGRASELLSEAYALDEENGLVLAELTLCYVRGEDFDAARFYLRLAEERVSRAPPEIYGVLGDVYDGLHRLEDAVVAWEEFVRLGGSDPVLLARLARARTELAVTRGQRSLALEHFDLFADATVEEDLVRRAGADLEASYAAHTALFGGRLDARQVVVLYAGRSYFSLVSVPDWSSGLFDGKIRVSVDPGATRPEALSAVLAHELGHAFIRGSSGGRASPWFHEGFAQWEEGRRIPVRDVRGAVGVQAAASSEALDRRLGSRLARPVARASYAQALSLFEYLVATRGTGAVACLLARLSGGQEAFAEALYDETGMSEAELFSGWKRWANL
ncbi:MAG TPA: tetratricopeptide repeat protein [Thermoanaerobaculia bacterium]|nr:tetratricopeptide repeat protein [Thermoanaerobaculia bacterium]